MREYIEQSNLIENVHDPAEIDQSMKAWEFLQQQCEFNLPVIRETHRLVMANLWPEIGGELRKVNVQVGANHAPAWYDVPILLDTWIYLMRNYKSCNPKNMHIKFEHIHPFRDGNGRTGRLLLWRHEQLRELPLTMIRYDDRFSYYDWF